MGGGRRGGRQNTQSLPPGPQKGGQVGTGGFGEGDDSEKKARDGWSDQPCKSKDQSQTPEMEGRNP